MKSFHFVLFSAALYILQGCGGGSPDTSTNIIQNAPEPPADGISGQVSSRINGATISVIDATGAEIVLASGRTTDSNGAYRLIFSEFAINAGITAPLIVTIDASRATAVCDFDGVTENDCRTLDGSFVSYGSTYILPDGFVLRGMAASYPPDGVDRNVTVNISATSDVATHYALAKAGGAALDEATVEQSMQQALGVTEFVTGLSSEGTSLNNIPIVDLTTGDTSRTDSLALALFSASLNGQIEPENLSAGSYPQVLFRLQNSIIPVPATGQLTATGSFLATSIASYLTGAQAFQATLATPLPVLTGAIAAQTATAPLLDQAGNNPIAISLPANPNSSDPLDQSKTFVTRLAEVMGFTLLISETNGFGGTQSGAASVYLEQLSVMATLTSREVRQAMLQLDAALVEALANGDTELSGTNVSGTLEFDGDTATLTNATTTIGNIQTGISVNITIPTGQRFSPGDTGIFDATQITIGVSQTQNDLTTQQLFQGTLTLNMVSTGITVDVASLDFDGAITAQSDLTFNGHVILTNLAPVDADLNSPVGTYDASFTFIDGSNLNMDGQLETGISSYTVNSGASTIIVDVETNTLTDMTTTLNLILDGGGNVTGGALTAQSISTGTVDDQGIVSYSDNTNEVLPTPII